MPKVRAVHPELGTRHTGHQLTTLVSPLHISCDLTFQGHRTRSFNAVSEMSGLFYVPLSPFELKEIINKIEVLTAVSKRRLKREVAVSNREVAVRKREAAVSKRKTAVMEFETAVNNRESAIPT
ncbi:hypothetical protein RRG08_041534 [Elysia crispata]|uniref:Uncharacterized protein n=1 Tax=Elysia crispata TaxID=231223 RepID=A0AAE0ZVH8_9GAST|nr:hypothetical protein RRG08_041534 [Elysia crispata]